MSNPPENLVKMSGIYASKFHRAGLGTRNNEIAKPWGKGFGGLNVWGKLTLSLTFRTIARRRASKSPSSLSRPTTSAAVGGRCLGSLMGSGNAGWKPQFCCKMMSTGIMLVSCDHMQCPNWNSKIPELIIISHWMQLIRWLENFQLHVFRCK